jgi:hypothetical protein
MRLDYFSKENKKETRKIVILVAMIEQNKGIQKTRRRS